MPFRFPAPLRAVILLIFSPLVGCSPGSPQSSGHSAVQSSDRREAPVLVRPVFPVTPPPVVRGGSAMVIDAGTGRILAGKNPYQTRAIASTQKLLTALLVIETGHLDKEVTIQRSDTLVEPTKIYLKVGEVHTRRELVRVIMVRSANDAAVALARDVGGSVEEFGVLMTRRARSLGMRDSVFKNPHGLTVPGQYSTARDLAILARAAYRQPFIRQCMRTEKFTFTHNDGRTRVLTNTNKLLKRFDYATGMKTGTTNASGKCLVSAAEYNGRTAIAVILKTSNAAVWSDSEKLLRWALSIPPNQ